MGAGSPGTVDPSRTLPLEFRVRTAADVLRLLDSEIARVQAAGSDVLARARVIALLAGTTLRAVEAADVQQRLEELERKISDATKSKTSSGEDSTERGGEIGKLAA